MRCGYALVLGMALIGLFNGFSRAQTPAKWNEANARQAAIDLSKKWHFSPAEFDGNAAKELQHDVYAVLPFDIPGTPRWILLIATAPPDNFCHACSPVTGAVIFAFKDGTWQPIYDQSQVTDLGNFGQPPTARVRNLGPAKPAIEFELTGMAQGYAGSSLTFVAEINQKLREVLMVATGASNEAADLPPDQTFNWQATVQVTDTIHDGFADIVVKCSGTKATEDGEKILPYSETATYRFTGEAYKKLE